MTPLLVHDNQVAEWKKRPKRGLTSKPKRIFPRFLVYNNFDDLDGPQFSCELSFVVRLVLDGELRFVQFDKGAFLDMKPFIPLN